MKRKRITYDQGESTRRKTDLDFAEEQRGRVGKINNTSLIASTKKAVMRIDSVNRLPGGKPYDFSISIVPRISKALAFYVSSVAIPNTWYNISAFLKNNTFVVNDTVITIPDGVYSAGQNASINTVIQGLLNDEFKQTDITVTYNGTTMKLSFSSPSIVLTFQTQTSGGVVGTANLALGISSDFSNSGGNPVEFPGKLYLIDFLKISLSSPQLRRPISGDSRPEGSNNCFMHLTINAVKGGVITFANPSPTDNSLILYPGTQDFSLIQIQVLDPRTQLPIPIEYDWEMEVHFLVEPLAM